MEFFGRDETVYLELIWKKISLYCVYVENITKYMYTHCSYVDYVTESFWDLLLFSVTPMLCPYIKSASTFPKVIFKHFFHLHTMYFPVVGICIQLLQWEQFQILFELKQLGENLKRI
jgi:hypothetical protein